MQVLPRLTEAGGPKVDDLEAPHFEAADAATHAAGGQGGAGGAALATLGGGVCRKGEGKVGMVGWETYVQGGWGAASAGEEKAKARWGMYLIYLCRETRAEWLSVLAAGIRLQRGLRDLEQRLTLDENGNEASTR